MHTTPLPPPTDLRAESKGKFRVDKGQIIANAKGCFPKNALDYWAYYGMPVL